MNTSGVINWLFCALLLAVGCLTGPFAKAQKYDLGVAAVYGDDIEQLGINTRFYLNSTNHRFCLGPEFSWFPTSSSTHNTETIEKDLIEFNFNAHVNLKLVNKLMFYPLAGLNYSREKEAEFLSGVLEKQETYHEFGANLGMGLHYNLTQHWLLYVEYDHLFSNLSQNTFTAGVLVGFGQFKKQTHHTPQHE